MISVHRFSKAALKTFHSAQVAMLFMQIVASAHNPVPNSAGLEHHDSVPCGTYMEPEVSSTNGNTRNAQESKYIKFSQQNTMATSYNSEWAKMAGNEISASCDASFKKGDEAESVVVDEVTSLSGNVAREGDVESAVTVVARDITGDEKEEVVGVVNEVAFNARAKREIGDVRLVWKMVAGRDHPQRKLILT